MKHELRVAIVGGGIAGLAAAAFLARDGHDVRVFEQAPDVMPVGTGILLQPAGIDVLALLGLWEAAFECGAPIERVVARSRAGAILMDLRYADLAPSLRGLGIRRPDLATLLLDAARTAGAQVLAGTAVEEVGGETLASRGPFDLVLICDGAGSRLRAGIGASHVRVHDRGVYSFVAPLPQSLDSRVLLQSLMGLRDAVGLLPIGRGAGPTPLVSFFWNAKIAERPALEATGFEEWRRYVAGFCPEAGELLRQAGSFGALTWSTTREVTMARWHRARALALGDAAHALNPQLGLGATMALIDAAAVRDVLRESAHDVPAALAAFESRRRAHLDGYARASRVWSWFDGAGFASLRRRLFHTAASIPVRATPPVARRLWLPGTMARGTADVINVRAMNSSTNAPTPIHPQQLEWLRGNMRVGTDMSWCVGELRKRGYPDSDILAAIEAVRPRGDAFAEGVMTPPLLRRAPAESAQGRIPTGCSSTRSMIS